MVKIACLLGIVEHEKVYPADRAGHRGEQDRHRRGYGAADIGRRNMLVAKHASQRRRYGRLGI